MQLQDIFSNLMELLSYDATAPMIFSSGLFWFLFILFMPIYAVLKNRRWQMLVFVVAFSLYFYYKSSGLFFLLLVCTSLLDWILSRVLVKLDSKGAKKACVAASIITSLSILGYFKYANFFLWNWNQMVEGNFQPLDIILPVGISFYTFQSISYIVDVYKGRVAPTRTWLEYLFFLSFFPALVAGPIVRADYFLPQVEQNSRPKREEIYLGFWMIILGIIKKAIIADYISQYNDLIFSSPTGYSGFESLMGVIGYTMQIYCDFSGYSDMAIGIALIMGFKLSPNFNFPYKSKNLTEFWRRWHISLSSWLRDYLYIPLGGNRKGTIRTYVNNFLTMLIGGLWHGAAWKFVFWGGMHGVGLAVHKASKPLLDKIPNIYPVKLLSWTVTIIYVSLLWVFFRAESWTDSWLIIKNIFTNFSVAHIAAFLEVRYVWCIMMAVIILSHAMPRRWYDKMGEMFVNSNWLIKTLIFIIVVQFVIQFMSEDVAPFIYFQF
ncbi:MAG: MBOAT family protein [Muribaculaceae bacterium]|nr:MBOAT family protein [Muribaculaceae bacterium]